MRRPLIAVSLVLMLVAVAACSSSSKKASTPSGGATTPDTSSGNPSSATPTSAETCKLLSDSDVSAATGAGAAGVPMDTGTTPTAAGNPIRVGCTWGELASGKPVIGVQISSKNGAPLDSLSVIADSAGASTPIDVGGTSGKLLTKALIPHGGGQGASIVIPHGDGLVVVGLTQAGETPVDQAKLVAAATAVNKNLG